MNLTGSSKSLHLSAPFGYVILFCAFLVLGNWLRVGNEINFTNFPIDYGNYIRGIQLLFQGTNPYGQVEFFAPPWIAFILSPYVLLKDPVFWQATCALFVFTLMFIVYNQLDEAQRQKKWFLITLTGLIFLPTTMFAITLGQLSSLMGLVITFLYIRLIQGKVNKWDFAFGLILLSLKPHVVFLPVFILILDLIRRKLWAVLLITFLTVTILALTSSFILYKGWLPAYLNAIFVTRKYLGGQGLAASFYFNLADVGISYFIFLPHLVYIFILWLKKGVSLYLFVILITLNFLIIPYSRQYDFVILLPAYIFIFTQLIKLRHYWGIIVGYLIIIFVPLFTSLFYIVPLLVLITLFLLSPENFLSQSLRKVKTKK